MMEKYKLLIYWYNPSKKNLYPVFYHNCYYNQGCEPGYINGHGHEIIAIFYIDDNKEFHSASHVGMYISYQDFSKEDSQKTSGIKDKIINCLIEKLNNFKSR